MGRPRSTDPKHKSRREYQLPGRYKERIERLHAKREKLRMLESLIYTYEHRPNSDVDYLRDLKKRANEVRTQLAVTSTVEPLNESETKR